MPPPKTPLEIASDMNNACALTPDPVAPEFLVSLNTCTPPEKVQPQLDPGSAKAVEAILEHIVGRLNGSLDPIWNGPDGHDPYWQPRAGCTPGEVDRLLAEEEWARWCTELMAATGYGGVSEYGSGYFDDVRFFRAFQDLPADRAKQKDQPLDDAERSRLPNPVVPVKMACQQLCTYAYYSMGLPFDKVRSQGSASAGYGVTASSNGHLSHLFNGGWDRSATYANLQNAHARQAGGITPGSILGFLPSGAKTQTKGSHVAFVLRTAPSVSKAQFFDTGAVTQQGRGVQRSKASNKPTAANAFNGGNYDDCLFQGVVGVYHSGVTVDCVGFGSLQLPSTATIRDGIAAARKARPLGMARLALLERSGGSNAEVLYVSPRVWLHDVASAANYYISRHLWSLRATPGYENIEALWQISHPANADPDLFASECFKATRAMPLHAVWGSRRVRPVTGFLAMSNDDRGQAILRHRVKLNPKRTKGQKLEPEPGRTTPYDHVLEYDYTVTQPDDSERRYQIRGLFAKVPPGEHWLAEKLRQQKFSPPRHFAPW